MPNTKTGTLTIAPRFESIDRLLVSIALLTVGTATVLFLLATIWVATSGAYNIEGVDINIIYSLQKLLRGFPLYGDPSQPPFEIVQYSPLFYLLCTALLKILSIPVNDIFGIARTARLVACSFDIGTCFVVFFIVSRQLHVRKTVALMAAASVLILTFPWCTLARPDSLMILLIATSTALGIKLSRRARESQVLTMACLTAGLLAACAKQNGILAVAPLLLFLALHRRWRSLAVSLAVLGVFLALAPFAATALFGHFWKANLVNGIRNGVDYWNAASRTYSGFLLLFAVFSAAAIATAWQWVIEPEEAELQYVGLSALVFFAEAILAGLKVGSAENYFNEFVVLAAVVLAVVADRFLCGSNATMLKRTLALCALLFLPLYTFRQLYSYVLAHKESGSLSPQVALRYDAYTGVASYLRQHLISGNYFVAYKLPVCLELPDQCIMPDPLNVYVSSRMRTVDYTRLKELSRDRRIQYVILPKSVTIDVAWSERPLPGLDPKMVQLEAEVGPANVYRIAACSACGAPTK